MLINDSLGNSQADPKAWNIWMRLKTLKKPEKLWRIFRVEAKTIVADKVSGFCFIESDCDRQPSFWAGVFDGVVQYCQQ